MHEQFAELHAEIAKLRTEVHDALRAQTRTVVAAILVGNSGLVLAVLRLS